MITKASVSHISITLHTVLAIHDPFHFNWKAKEEKQVNASKAQLRIPNSIPVKLYVQLNSDSALPIHNLTKISALTESVVKLSQS